MIALAGPRRDFHFTQQRIHLLGAERAARAHRIVAGDGGEPMVEPALERLMAVLGERVFGEVAHQPFEIARGDQARRLAHQYGAGAEALQDKSQRFQLGRALDERCRRGGVEVDDQRREQDLPDDARLGALAFQLLVDDPLMRGVLIDDDNAIAGLGDDVIHVQLRARGAERRGDVAARRSPARLQRARSA